MAATVGPRQYGGAPAPAAPGAPGRAPRRAPATASAPPPPAPAAPAAAGPRGAPAADRPAGGGRPRGERHGALTRPRSRCRLHPRAKRPNRTVARSQRDAGVAVTTGWRVQLAVPPQPRTPPPFPSPPAGRGPLGWGNAGQAMPARG